MKLCSISTKERSIVKQTAGFIETFSKQILKNKKYCGVCKCTILYIEQSLIEIKTKLFLVKFLIEHFKIVYFDFFVF